jgi:superfamily II DNA/RNA helicase
MIKNNLKGDSNMLHNDLTFFTNEEENTLKDRFRKVLSSHTQFFDILVGYFRTSGFFELYKSLENTEKIRILVGMDVDKKTVDLIHSTGNEQLYFTLSSNEIKDKYKESLQSELENSEDTKEVELGVNKFIEYIKTGKLEIRMYPNSPIHAKVYILRKDLSKVPDQYGSVITGSSNFSSAGLINNLEFNVELKDFRDVKFALDRFEKLWNEGVDLSEEYINTIKKHTWLREDITPYELYLKFLYEYFKEEINADKEVHEGIFLPEGYKKLQYQEDAVNRAKKILDAYGGVFIADVVGLGKTYICAMLAQKLKKGKKLVICPPVLKDYWKKVMIEFDVSVRVESIGKLDQLLEEGVDNYSYVFIDEAHRFRNQETESYQKLHQICYGKQVILISATPQNNNPTDIANQIYLFQNKHNSDIIPNIKNIERFFTSLQKRLEENEKGSSEYVRVARENSKEIRDKVLQNIMVRRTRQEIEKFYEQDLKRQGLEFPKLTQPKKIIYKFDESVENIFNITIEVIQKLNYARYKPLTYLKRRESSDFAAMLVGQRNMGGFMKAILIKRLESSFYAFSKTIERFIFSYKKFIDMYNTGAIYISKKVNIYDLLDSGNEEELLRLIEQENVQKYMSFEFEDNFIVELNEDLCSLERLQNLWSNIKSDPKLDDFIKYLTNDAVLTDSKILIFTESTETAEYLNNALNNVRPGEVVLFTGKSSDLLRNEIEYNFNPDYKGTENKKRSILVTTDVLAEGINLHKSNVIINYDLPWNPTKIMQRVGRINRVGTKHRELFVYNFFPTSQSSEHLSLEQNILTKIQAFHDTLGEDFKYLSDEEQVSSHELFGKRFLEKLQYLNEDELDETESELKYLKLLRNVRDKSPSVFNKIQVLPKKARAGRYSSLESNEAVLTFFRKGALKKFFITNDITKLGVELRLFDAINLVEANESTKSVKISSEYFDYLEKNKKAFAESISEEEQVMLTNASFKRSKSDSKVINMLKALKRIIIIEEEVALLSKLIEVWENGVIPIKTTKEVLSLTKGMTDPYKIFKTILGIVPEQYLTHNEKSIDKMEGTIEIILSSYLKKG